MYCSFKFEYSELSFTFALNNFTNGIPSLKFILSIKRDYWMRSANNRPT
jgi:hypothetical protein